MSLDFVKREVDYFVDVWGNEFVVRPKHERVVREAVESARAAKLTTPEV